MFDTHCHLNFRTFEQTLNSVIEEAREVEVDKFLIPGVDLESSQRSVQISEDYVGAYAAIGVHPTQDLESLSLEKIIYQLEEMASLSENVVAIGEIGLDYYRYKSASRIQKRFFAAQVKLAVKLDKSVIIHNRHASDDIVSVLDEIDTSPLSGKIVFHCCSPEKNLLDYAITNNVYIGVDGDVTYDRQKQNFIKKVPLELLVLETDSPFLIPEPLRSEKLFPNTPSSIPMILKTVREIKSNNDIIADKILSNSNLLFGLSG